MCNNFNWVIKKFKKENCSFSLFAELKKFAMKKKKNGEQFDIIDEN